MPPHPSAPCQGCCSLPISSFLSFILFGCVGIFLVFLGVQRVLLVFSRCSVRTENSSICRHILDVLVRIGEFHILLSILTPPPQNVLSTSSLLAQKDIPDSSFHKYKKNQTFLHGVSAPFSRKSISVQLLSCI